jgi:peptide/nickel transport system permease protein
MGRPVGPVVFTATGNQPAATAAATVPSPPSATGAHVMLQDGFKFVRDKEQWIVVPPGVAIAVTVLGFNLLGDALRSALDPKVTR